MRFFFLSGCNPPPFKPLFLRIRPARDLIPPPKAPSSPGLPWHGACREQPGIAFLQKRAFLRFPGAAEAEGGLWQSRCVGDQGYAQQGPHQRLPCLALTSCAGLRAAMYLGPSQTARLLGAQSGQACPASPGAL